MKKLTVVLSYVPNVETFGPEYALHNGFFKEQGLDVTLVPAGQGVDQVQMVASGAADIGITDPETILAGVARGEKFKVFAAEFQKSPVAMTCRKDANVAKPVRPQRQEAGRENQRQTVRRSVFGKERRQTRPISRPPPSAVRTSRC